MLVSCLCVCVIRSMPCQWSLVLFIGERESVCVCDAQHAVCEYLRDVVRRRLLRVVLRQLLCLVRRLVEHLPVAVADEVLRQVLEVCHHPLLVEVAHVRDPVQQLGFLRVQLEVALCGGVLGVRRMATECAVGVEWSGVTQSKENVRQRCYICCCYCYCYWQYCR